MKKTQWIDALRNIRANIVSYLSIVVIAMLAVTAYLGITYTAEAQRRNASSYYTAHNMWDLEVASTLLMDEGDLDAIRALPGVETAEAVYEMTANLSVGQEKKTIDLMAFSEEISTPELIDGKLPSNSTECAVEFSLANELGIRTGQHISIGNATLVGIDPVAQKDFVVTGIFNSPDHITERISITPYVLVKPESFNLELLDGQFMKTRIRVAGTPEKREGTAYREAVSPVMHSLTDLADVRKPLREKQVHARLDELIRQGEEKLDAAALQLKDGRAQLDAGQEELRRSAAMLDDALSLLDSGSLSLADGKKQLEEGEAELRDGKAKLDKVEFALIRGKEEVLEAAVIAGFPQELIDKLRDLDISRIMDFLYEASGYNRGYEKYIQGLIEYESGRLDWYYGGEKYLDGVTKYNRALLALEKGKEQLADGQAEFDLAMEQLEAAKKMRRELIVCDWIIMDNNSNGGYVFARLSSDNLSSLSFSFSMIFVIIGALVIYSTVGRIVEEQSVLVGATKAMGLYNREIFAKYLVFGGTSTMIGVLLGIAMAYFVVQKALIVIYVDYFVLPEAKQVFLLLPTLLVVIGAIILSFASVWFACTQLLRSTAISLMQGSTLVSKIKKARRSSGGSLYRNLIIMNMRSDLKRVIVTIVSIAGCCTLLMIGFTLKFAISRVNSRQFGEIVTHDMQITFDTEATGSQGAEVENVLREKGFEYCKVFKTTRAFSIGEDLNSATLICADAEKIGDYYDFFDSKTHEAITLSDSGVLIPQRMQEYYHLNAGDTFDLYDENMIPKTATADRAFENYSYLMLCCTPAAYEKIFDTKVTPNCFLVRLNGADPAALRAELDPLPGVLTITDNASDLARFNQLTAVLDYLILAMTIMAGLMAYFILLNLSKTYIQRKTRELTIMRINGFSVRECIRYASWDLVVTTVIGILCGLGLGAWLGYLITRLMEQPHIMYVRQPDLHSFVYSMLITAFFSIAINAWALRKIRTLKLSDV